MKDKNKTIVFKAGFNWIEAPFPKSPVFQQCVRVCVCRHADTRTAVIMVCLGYDRALTRHMRVRVSVCYAGISYLLLTSQDRGRW